MLSKKSAAVVLDRLEKRTFLSATVGGWTVMSGVPKARGLTTDLRLADYTPLTLAADSIANSLSKAPLENVAKYGIGKGAGSRLISLPTPDGGFARFRIVESSILTGNDQKKYGKAIRTFAGVGVDDPTASVRLDFTPLGFHAQVLTKAGDGAYYIDPLYRNSQSVYASYYASDNLGRDTQSGATADDIADVHTADSAATTNATAARTSGTQLRTYRTAVATTGEYTAYFGGTATAGLAAVVTSMNRVTGIYETELSIRLTLVSNNSTLIYTSSSSDPYTNSNPDSLLTQNQTTIDSKIGNANYDIGHVFSTAGGGLAGLGVVGVTGSKAQGETGMSAPVGDAFDVDYVAHEMGHQFGADHTFNTTNEGTSYGNNRNAGTAFEPGSGSTIMAYAGIEGAPANGSAGTEDLQAHSDPYFAFVSLNEIFTYVDVTRSSVGTKTSTGNSIPTVTTGTMAYTIPANTPFTLTSPTASDANGDTVYYSWEEADLGADRYLNQADNGSSPLFRVYNPTTSPGRTFPQLASILNGTNITYVSGSTVSKAEQLPTTSRTMKFVLTLRDKKAGGGGTNVLSGAGNGTTAGTITPTATVTSVAAASTFAVSNFNTASTVAGGSNQTITWNVAGTTANGINTANVSILMSTDGGQTFPTTLAASTANDGTETVQLPYNTASSQVRFKVAAVGNIYFDINNANLTLTNVAPPASATPGVPDLVTASDTGTNKTDNLTKLNNSAGQTLQFNVTGTISGATVTLYADGNAIGTAVASSTTTTVTTNGTNVLNDSQHTFTATQTESGKPASATSASLAVTIDSIAPSYLASPEFSYLVTKPQITVKFSENVYGNSTGNFDVTKTNAPTGSVNYNNGGDFTQVIITFPGAPNQTLPNGTYTLTSSPTSSLTDAAGNAFGNSLSFGFFVLAGDADHNRVVDFNDFLALQNNYNTSQLDFSKGDFDYNGVIDFNDFLILQNNYGTTV